MLQDRQGLEKHFQLLATYSLAPFYPGDIPPPLYRAQSIIPVKYHRAQTIHHPSQI